MNQPAATGDQSLERFRSYLYVLARAHLDSRLRQKLDASDIVQQTLLDAHQKNDQFCGENDAQRAGWLRQILANNMADAVRYHARKKRNACREQSLEAGIEESFGRAECWIASSGPSPSQRIAKEEEILMVSEAITRLPLAQQQAVIMHHLQGLKLAEVAERMQRTETAVAGLLYRGIRRLNEMLDKGE